MVQGPGQLAAAGIERSPTRAGITAAAVALIIGAAITLSSLSMSFRQSLDDYIARLLDGDLVVSAVSTEGGWLEMPLPESLTSELSALPGVRAVHAMRVIPGQSFRGHRIGILALDEGLIAPTRQPPLAAGDPPRRPTKCEPDAASTCRRRSPIFQRLPELLAFHASVIGRAFQFTDTIQMLLVIVTVAGIFDLLLASIAERRRELALWRLIGAADHMVRRSIAVESGTIGVIGAALGVLLGHVTAWMWVAINYRYLIGFHLQYHFATLATVWFALLVLVATVAAGWIAGSHAMRQPAIAGIRSD